MFDAFASVDCTRRMKTKSVDYSRFTLMLYILHVFSAIRIRVAVAQLKESISKTKAPSK